MQSNVHTRQVRLVRDNVVLSPVYSELIANNERDGEKVGYLRLTSFNQKAGDEMRKAIVELKQSGANSFVLDLRDNPGGLVNAGLDVAAIWLHPNDVVLHVVTRDGVSKTVSISPNSPPPITQDPLIVMVNKNSASASEILAGALHDNRRAKLIGGKTFGKGKMQNVFELGDGGALFVTVAKYQTPSHHNIDKVGLPPDKVCSPLLKAAPSFDIESDPCFVTAEKALQPPRV
mmetsp:Transcript_4606/g.12043  ORF Transcript_4606/g.12043 Transcript_4606/m.12043 type:complete len:232 (+) Transcript_4606:1105-1800(+)